MSGERPPEGDATGRRLAPAAPTRPLGRPPRRQPPLGALVLGLFLVLVGIGWLLEATDALEVPWGGLVPGMLIAVGIALVIASRTGQKSGGLVAIGVVLALTAALFAAVDVPLGSGVGERDERPDRAEDLQRSYELAVGELVLDLSRLEVPVGTTRVEARVAVGELQVIVPADVALEIQGRVSAGEVDVLDRSANGLGAETAYRDRDYPEAERRLGLDLSVGLGKLEVRR
jgi:hypothetical protein